MIFQWRQHVPNLLSRPGSDYVRLNIASVDDGALTSPEVSQKKFCLFQTSSAIHSKVSKFRKEHDYRLRQGARQSSSHELPSHLKSITFGIFGSNVEFEKKMNVPC